MAEKLMIIDGNSIANRAFYGIRMLTNKDGIPTNAVYGFINILLKNLSDIDPDYVTVAFDLSAPTFRHKMFDGYKAQRKGMPDELRTQMPMIKEVISAMQIPILEYEGYEADDIIGTISSVCEKKGIECCIITGDKDDLQLASKLTKIYLTTTSMGSTKTDIYDDAAVFERYGVTPTEFIDVKALMGDSSDNIPGVKGIGEKTAMSLIQAAKNIETLYADLTAYGVKGATLTKLEAGKEDAVLSKKLATINREVPLNTELDSMRDFSCKGTLLYSILKQYDLKSVIQKLGLSAEVEECDASTTKYKLPDVDVVFIEDEIEFKEALSKTVKERLIYKTYFQNGSLQSISFKCENTVYLAMCSLLLSENALIQTLSPYLADEAIGKITHGAKEDMVLFGNLGYRYNSLLFDTEIAAYILNPSLSSYELSELADSFLSLQIKSQEDTLGKGKKALSLLELEEGTLKSFISGEICTLELLEGALSDNLKSNDQFDLYEQIELPLISVLADMQINGFAVDKDRLDEFNKMLTERIDALTEEIHADAGCVFNINSTKQLGEVLFEKLSLRAVKKTKTGYSTDASVLDKLRGQHPIIEKIIEYRLISKIKSTYGDGLLAVINEKTGRIHSSFNQTVTVTGRISSTEPNMQNIPVRHPLGREIRKMFVAQGEDMYLVDADYSQIELRVLAHIAKDKNMIEAFEQNEDIHAKTASEVLHIPIEDVTSEQRSAAKAVNFGIVYGIGQFSLAQDLKIAVSEAKAYIDGYLSYYSGIAEYMENIKKTAAEHGYVTTLFGRRRYIPELKSSNFNLRAFGERVALNTPIQGTAADIIKLAMVRVYNRLKAEKLRARLILQVHDELIIECPACELDAVRKLLKQEMENVIELDAKLLAEEKYGKSWYETK